MSIISTLKTIKRAIFGGSHFRAMTQDMDKAVLNSQDFKNNNIQKCFASKVTHTPNKVIIDRIVTAYNKAKAVQKDLPEAYQVGNEWLPIYNGCMGDIMQALNTSNLTGVNTIYENFMREDCSVGLHGLPVDMKKTYFIDDIPKPHKYLYLHDVLYRYKHWKKLTGNKYTEKDLSMPNYGNPYGYYINNEFIRVGAEYFHYYAERIAGLIKDEKGKKVVIELGGGYGGQGYFLNKVIPGLTYIDFDLPENMALSAYYLMCAYPEKKVLLYGEDDFTEENIKEFDIIIMPNFEITKLPSNIANLAFNSYSLAEMSTETINTYIPELKRASKEYIFHINHSQLSYSLKADDFGIDDDNYKLLSREPALWNMGRNLNMDEYEYLYLKKPLN